MAIYIDDGRRKMPKLKCPYCSKRFADVSSPSLRNESSLLKLQDVVNPQYIMECHNCHKKIALVIRSLETKCNSNSKNSVYIQCS